MHVRTLWRPMQRNCSWILHTKDQIILCRPYVSATVQFLHKDQIILWHPYVNTTVQFLHTGVSPRVQSCIISLYEDVLKTVSHSYYCGLCKLLAKSLASAMRIPGSIYSLLPLEDHISWKGPDGNCLPWSLAVMLHLSRIIYSPKSSYRNILMTIPIIDYSHGRSYAGPLKSSEQKRT